MTMTQYKKLAPNSHIKIWNLSNHMKKWNKEHQTLSFHLFTNRFNILMFFVLFFMWFAWFQILISEPQSISCKLLVLSWLYEKISKNWKSDLLTILQMQLPKGRKSCVQLLTDGCNQSWNPSFFSLGHTCLVLFTLFDCSQSKVLPLFRKVNPCKVNIYKLCNEPFLWN